MFRLTSHKFQVAALIATAANLKSQLSELEGLCEAVGICLLFLLIVVSVVARPALARTLNGDDEPQAPSIG